MGRIGRLVDHMISAVEGLIERVGDPNAGTTRNTMLERESDLNRRVVVALRDQVNHLRREIAPALNVEGESDAAITAAAWKARGEIGDLRAQVEFLESTLRNVRSQLLAGTCDPTTRANCLATIERALDLMGVQGG